MTPPGDMKEGVTKGGGHKRGSHLGLSNRIV